MKPNIIHSIVVCLTAFTLPLMVACSSQEESLPDNVTEAVLYLNIVTLGQTNAGVDNLPDIEKMQSLRVIVLHADGTVEHNRYYSLNGAQTHRDIILKVTPHEKKKIFLFANEESVSQVTDGTVESGKQTLTAFFNSYTKGKDNFGSTVGNLYFAPAYSSENPIPMSSMYEVDLSEQENFNGTFYVVRVATKFTVNFYNWRGEEVTVNNFSIASHADNNFLMARVDDSDRNKQLFGEGNTWIDWLKAVSEASNDNSDAATEKYGWLKDYQLPEGSNHVEYKWDKQILVEKPNINATDPDKSEPGLPNEIPVFYLPESKNTPKTENTDGSQEYKITLRINGIEKPFEFPLSNLESLFRNTHVIVNITFNKKNGITSSIEVRSWNNVRHTEIIL